MVVDVPGSEELDEPEVEGWSSIGDDSHGTVEGVDVFVEGLGGGGDALVLGDPGEDVAAHFIPKH